MEGGTTRGWGVRWGGIGGVKSHIWPLYLTAFNTPNWESAVPCWLLSENIQARLVYNLQVLVDVLFAVFSAVYGSWTGPCP